MLTERIAGLLRVVVTVVAVFGANLAAAATLSLVPGSTVGTGTVSFSLDASASDFSFDGQITQIFGPGGALSEVVDFDGFVLTDIGVGDVLAGPAATSLTPGIDDFLTGTLVEFEIAANFLEAAFLFDILPGGEANGLFSGTQMLVRITGITLTAGAPDVAGTGRVIVSNFGTVAPVPLPGTLPLALAALAGLCGLARLSRRG